MIIGSLCREKCRYMPLIIVLQGGLWNRKKVVQCDVMRGLLCKEKWKHMCLIIVGQGCQISDMLQCLMETQKHIGYTRVCSLWTVLGENMPKMYAWKGRGKKSIQVTSLYFICRADLFIELFPVISRTSHFNAETLTKQWWKIMQRK